MFKKILSLSLIFLLNSSYIPFIYATSSSLKYEYLRLNWNNANIEITPQSSFWLDASYSSTSATNIKEARLILAFKNTSWTNISSDFAFDWSKFKTTVYTFDSNTDIQNADFWANWLDTFLTNAASWDTAEAYNFDIMSFLRKDNALSEWFYVNSTASDYEIVLESNVIWKNVSESSVVSSLPVESKT